MDDLGWVKGGSVKGGGLRVEEGGRFKGAKKGRFKGGKRGRGRKKEGRLSMVLKGRDMVG